MKFTLALILCGLILPTSQDSYNKILQFPEDSTVEDYVQFEAVDFSDVQEEITICSWIQSYESTLTTWLSYAVSNTVSDWELYLRSDINTESESYNSSGIFNSAIDGITGSLLSSGFWLLPNNTWYHYCFSWDVKSAVANVYIDGELRTSLSTPDGRKIGLTDGTLVLGQGLPWPGSSFHYTFRGELQQVNILRRKLTAGEIKDIYEIGRCASLEHSFKKDVMISWDDFLNAKRYGKVVAVNGNCTAPTAWEVLYDYINDNKVWIGVDKGFLDEVIGHNNP